MDNILCSATELLGLLWVGVRQDEVEVEKEEEEEGGKEAEGGHDDPLLEFHDDWLGWRGPGTSVSTCPLLHCHLRC